MDNKIENRIKEILSTVFEVSIDEIDENLSLHKLMEWDSLNHMKMIAVIEEEFSIKLDLSEIESMISFDIIKATIAAYID